MRAMCLLAVRTRSAVRTSPIPAAPTTEPRRSRRPISITDTSKVTGAMRPGQPVALVRFPGLRALATSVTTKPLWYGAFPLPSLRVGCCCWPGFSAPAPCCAAQNARRSQPKQRYLSTSGGSLNGGPLFLAGFWPTRAFQAKTRVWVYNDWRLRLVLDA